MQTNYPEQQQKVMEFFETYCRDCNNGTEVIELIDAFKIVE